jgi:hypothetical protein
MRYRIKNAIGLKCKIGSKPRTVYSFRWILIELGNYYRYQITAKEIPGCYGLEKHKPWFDEGS